MLKKIRVVLAFVCLTIFLALFWVPDITRIAPAAAWLAKIQLSPAIIAGSFIIVCLILLATLLFGRLYCSIICPLGILQDALTPYARKFAYRRDSIILRASMLLLFTAAIFTGTAWICALIDPYSIFGKIAASFSQLAITLFTDNSLPSPVASATGVLFFIIIALMAWKFGRLWCNSICPVGALLGIVSKFAIFKIRINQATCVRCGMCERSCKSSCIAIAGKHSADISQLDASRCVSCFNCLDACKFDAIGWRATLRKEENY